jgi:membrane protein DedA with SNARE-associated domain
MPLLIAAVVLLSWDLQSLMQHAFYPVLLLVLVAASLGVPIPEDVPLIAAGVILSQQPGLATWTGTVLMALLGIMCGDVVLYVLGGRWGPEVCQHRWVNWLITPARLERMTRRFNRYGMWMCFFGRFFMGVRAAMCITAGVTRLSFWRFVLADLAGALLSIPLFVWLGFWFASMLPTLKTYVHLIQWGLLATALLILAGFVAYRRYRPIRTTADGSESRPSVVTASHSAPVEQVSPTASRPQAGGRPRPKMCGSESAP